MSRAERAALLALWLVLASCARHQPVLPDFTPANNFAERTRVLEIYPGVTATLVAPARIDSGKRVDLILYALPNGNTTLETMGRKAGEGIGWRYDIQHIAAQTRALRARGLDQAIVAYLEANTKSWPEWRRVNGIERANRRIVEIVDQIRTAIGNPPNLSVTLTGHSGGGSFTTGFLDGQEALPSWLERIAYLDSNYSFETRHADKLTAWLRSNPRNTLVVLAYDDREIMLDGKKVVSDSGGTWRATQRMVVYLRGSQVLEEGKLGEFIRYSNPQIEILLHPNPENRILHTVMIGEMNGYMHALLVRRPGYESVLRPERAYSAFVGDEITLPAATPPAIPARDPKAPGGRAFMSAIAGLTLDAREAAIRHELLAGNIPGFLRALRPVTYRDSTGHEVTYEVMPDYLAIGSDDDYVRMPMNPYTAQAFCDAYGFVLPTRRMVNDIWKAANVHVEPRPLTQARESPLTFLQHHQIIEEQLKGGGRGGFVGGIKKDVVVTNKLQEKPNRVAIYGWHYVKGDPIQPLYTGHVDWYVDYSHGIRPVRRALQVDGKPTTYEKILADSSLAVLLSDEGVIAVPRYVR